MNFIQGRNKMCRMAGFIETTSHTSGYIDLNTLDFHSCPLLGNNSTPYTTVQTTKEIESQDGSSVLKLNCSDSVIHKISLRFRLPEIRLKNLGTFKRLRWTRNLAHNLVELISLKINEKEVWKFDSISLDCINAFRKGDDYYRLIGNIPELINPTSISSEKGICLPSTTVYLPLDFQSQSIMGPGQDNAFLIIKYRKIEDVLIIDDFLSGVSRPVHETDLVSMPTIKIALTKSYKLFGEKHVPRPMKLTFNSTNIDISELVIVGNGGLLWPKELGLVHCMYFGMRNKSNLAEHSNYSTIDPYLSLKCIDGLYVPGGVDFGWSVRDVSKNKIMAYLDSLYIMPDLVWTIVGYYDPNEKEIDPDPIHAIKLFYEGTTRLNDEADFFSKLHPYNVGGKVPTVPGYHMYCFGSDLNKIDCVTNFYRLTNTGVIYDLNSMVDSTKFDAFVITHMIV